MWGTRAHHEVGLTSLRFIPTHVGNTYYLFIHALIGSVHPHACGEHDPATDTADTTTGSSPRMWGTLSRGKILEIDVRFIPTHVGNTSQRRNEEGQA